jgi:hypothetical protein
MLQAKEKYELSFNGYGAFKSGSLDSISVVLNKMFGLIVHEVSFDRCKTVTFGSSMHKDVVVRWSEDGQYWYGGI